MYSPPPPNITNNIDFFFFREAGGVDVRRLGIPSVSWGVAAYFSCEIIYVFVYATGLHMYMQSKTKKKLTEKIPSSFRIGKARRPSLIWSSVIVHLTASFRLGDGVSNLNTILLSRC